MKSLVYHKENNDITFKLKELPKPKINDYQVLIKVKCVALSIVDFSKYARLKKISLFIFKKIN